MSVRAASLDDLPALLELERNNFPHDAWNEASLRETLTDEKYLVLVWDTATSPSAYILGWNVGDEAEIARVGVLPSHRRQGLATTLLDAALAAFQARGVRQVFLEVRAGNAPARGLYASRGFESVGLRRRYYADGEDALVLSWGLL